VHAIDVFAREGERGLGLFFVSDFATGQAGKVEGTGVFLFRYQFCHRVNWKRLVVIMGWKEERRLGCAGRGCQSSKDLNKEGDIAWYIIGSLSE
jgi:hypothetical protein